MKPRRCAHQTYVTDVLSSRATRSARRFSSPSRLLLENGRLFGSAQTRNGAAAGPGRSRSPEALSGMLPEAVAAMSTGTAVPITARATRLPECPLSDLWKRKDIQHPALLRHTRQIL